MVTFQAGMGLRPAEEVTPQSAHCSDLPAEAGCRRAGGNSLWASFINDVFHFVYLYWFSSLQNEDLVLISLKYGSQSQMGMRSGDLGQAGAFLLLLHLLSPRACSASMPTLVAVGVTKGPVLRNTRHMLDTEPRRQPGRLCRLNLESHRETLFFF